MADRELTRLWVVLVPRWGGRHPRDWVFATTIYHSVAAYSSRSEARAAVYNGQVMYAGRYFSFVLGGVPNRRERGKYRIEGIWADAIGASRNFGRGHSG